MKRITIAVGLIALFGAIRLPVEIHIAKEQQAAGFHSATLDLPLRQQLGQSSFLAALSGFRSLVAAILWIEAHEAFEKVEWGRMAGLLRNVTTLQPKSELYWDMSGWHMGWNASVNALEDKEKQPSKTLRELDERNYWERGKKFFEDGIRNNPDSAVLWADLGRIESQKFQNHDAAAEAFATAATKPNALPYMRRIAAYELMQVPGREREAYEKLKALYDEGEKERLPTLVRNLQQLEEKLGIPARERIKEANAH